MGSDSFSSSLSSSTSLNGILVFINLWINPCRYASVKMSVFILWMDCAPWVFYSQSSALRWCTHFLARECAFSCHPVICSRCPLDREKPRFKKKVFLGLDNLLSVFQHEMKTYLLRRYHFGALLILAGLHRTRKPFDFEKRNNSKPYSRYNINERVQQIGHAKMAFHLLIWTYQYLINQHHLKNVMSLAL